MLKIEHLVKSFTETKGARDRVMAVNDIDLQIEPGQLFTLLGPSGCGKTTTLRCVAGLEHPDSGRIVVGDRTLYSSQERVRLRANQRGLGMVFQSYAIWPHLNVLRNVAFPLEVLPRDRRPSKKEIKQRVERVLDTVRLGHLADRQATDLSGGQQQRLALARALVMEPPLLLLDEPLSNLDAKLREEMRFELKRLQRELGITCMYVTHDQVEALAMSNLIAVMNHGVIEQMGKPREIYDRPANRFVADFVGTTNLIEGEIRGVEGQDGYLIATDHGELRATSAAALPVGASVLVSIRPEHIKLEKEMLVQPGPGTWAGRIRTRAFLGECTDHVVGVGSLELQVRCNPSLSIPPGTDVTMTFDENLCTVLPAG